MLVFCESFSPNASRFNAKIFSTKASVPIARPSLKYRTLQRSSCASVISPPASQTLATSARIDNRITQAFTIQLALQGLDALWGAAGGAGIQLTQPVQRAWRDGHAVAHHVSFNWDALSSMYGQHLLGLEPQGHY